MELLLLQLWHGVQQYCVAYQSVCSTVGTWCWFQDTLSVKCSTTAAQAWKKRGVAFGVNVTLALTRNGIGCWHSRMLHFVVSRLSRQDVVEGWAGTVLLSVSESVSVQLSATLLDTLAEPNHGSTQP